MTTEEYIITINDAIHSNNRIIRENQTIQTRLLTMLDNAYYAINNQQPIMANPTANPTVNPTVNPTANTINNRSIRPSQNNTNRFIQDYVLSYIFEPYTNVNTTTTRTEAPTAAQITNSTDTLVYDSSNTLFTTHVCPITLTDFVNGENLLCIRQCQHIYKETSLMNWFSRNSRCPLCRYDIRNYSDDEETDEEPPPLEPADNNPFGASRTRNLTPLIRNITSNIPDTITNEISDIFTSYINNPNFINNFR